MVAKKKIKGNSLSHLFIYSLPPDLNEKLNVSPWGKKTPCIPFAELSHCPSTRLVPELISNSSIVHIQN